MKTNKNQVHGVVYVTDDYSMFSFFKSNREPKHWPKIANSLKEKDMAEYVPILVDRKFRIIDGQGRYWACKELGLPIYFIIGERCEEEDIIRMNVDRTDWKTPEYLDYYVSHEYPQYIRLADLIDRCSFMDLGKVLRIWQYRKDSNMLDEFRRGLYRISDEGIDKVVAVNRLVKKIYGLTNHEYVKANSFVAAVSSIYLNKHKIDIDVLLERIQSYPHLVEKRTTLSDYVDVLENVYNYRTRNKISFKYLDQ